MCRVSTVVYRPSRLAAGNGDDTDRRKMRERERERDIGSRTSREFASHSVRLERFLLNAPQALLSDQSDHFFYVRRTGRGQPCSTVIPGKCERLRTPTMGFTRIANCDVKQRSQKSFLARLYKNKRSGKKEREI